MGGKSGSVVMSSYTICVHKVKYGTLYSKNV